MIPNHTQELNQALSLIGDKWSTLILLEMAKGPQRFNALQAVLGINNSTLSDRLRALQEADLIEKYIFKEYPPRIEYRLTARGRDLEPVLQSLAAWVRKYLLGGTASHHKSPIS